MREPSATPGTEAPPARVVGLFLFFDAIALATFRAGGRLLPGLHRHPLRSEERFQFVFGHRSRVSRDQRSSVRGPGVTETGVFETPPQMRAPLIGKAKLRDALRVFL